MSIRSNLKPTVSSFGVEQMPRIAYGRGSYVYDVDGKRYLDGSGGPAVYAIGHANEEVNSAIRTQMDQIAHAYRYTFTSDASDELQELVLRKTNDCFERVIFVSSGSEAVESCLKIALQFWSAVGQPKKRRFIARRRSWHGNTLGALSVSDFKSRRASFEGSLLDVSFVSAANDYRRAAGVTSEGLAHYLADELEAEILRIGADNVAAFIFEPVVGAAGGVVPAPAGYAQAIRNICDRHNVLLIADEVMCGSGRVGTFRALEPEGVRPDIMAIAKGLAAGYIPLGATLYSRKIADAIDQVHGGPQTGHTFTGHTAACAAGLAVQKLIQREGLIEHVATRGARLQDELRAAMRHIPEVGDIRGRGYFIGIELVADPATKVPFDHQLQLHARIGSTAFERGLIVYPCAGNVDGISGDTVIVAPPYNASDDELSELVDTLTSSIISAVESVS
ncbi:aspartate aminotransferase family protein [Phyllobacterium sp. SYP-B3895]|uniref:aspartate aminotransferase family protein n=1 Tax=Phyllobacterium sp. SYP-B3895 TaxID=2663240 RepID=UPI001299C981|nr:aspartate aminotransferase family protein [Phyllobacterium sp. SYP-B3895]MRG57773.1 aspartate aminotransferase family protein [Phyllobacterium sp. SYP-B3895]